MWRPPQAGDYGQATKVHLKRRELNPAKLADKQAQKGNLSPFGYQVKLLVAIARYVGHGVQYRPKVAENGYMERGNPLRLSLW